jgi:hypothetical protein
MKSALLTVFVVLVMSGASFALAKDASPQNPLRIVHTRHYDIHTDMDQSLVTDLSQRMDAMFDQYGKAFPEFKPPASTPPLPVYLFATHEKYMAFTDYAGINTGGVFMTGRHSYLAAYEQGQGRDALRRTLQHEAFHQFAHSAIDPQLPPWMNEGMAQCFEESIWTGHDFLNNEVPPRRVRQLHVDIIQHRLVDFDKFLAITPREWTTTLHSNIDKAATAYNQAWAMAYFCSAAGDADDHARFMQLLEKLHARRESVAEATKDCFPDLKDFRKKFNAWAAALKPTPQATLIERLDTLGDFLIAVGKSREIPETIAGFRNLVVSNNLKIQYTRGKVTYSTDDHPIEYFSDLSDRVYTPDELSFKPDASAPFPDILCAPKGAAYRYRTHFYDAGGVVEHEVFVEGK